MFTCRNGEDGTIHSSWAVVDVSVHDLSIDDEPLELSRLRDAQSEATHQNPRAWIGWHL